MKADRLFILQVLFLLTFVVVSFFAVRKVYELVDFAKEDACGLCNQVGEMVCSPRLQPSYSSNIPNLSLGDVQIKRVER